MADNETTKTQRPLVKRIFLSPDEPRLRAGWRLFLQSLLLISTGIIFSFPLMIALQSLGILMDPMMSMIVNGGISFLSITASVLIARRIFDRRTIVSLGLKINRHTLEDLLAGFLIPALMMALIFFLERIFGWTEFVGMAWQQSSVESVLFSIFSGLAAFIIVGWQEELLSRGYHLQNLEDGLNLPWAVFLSSALFSLMHLANPNSEQRLMVIVGMWLGGMFFAYAYIRTRQLWLPIGLHIGWNFFEGPVFGFPVSGLNPSGLFIHTTTGPEIVTGGAFGPEAGLILLPSLALGVGLIVYVTHGRQPKKTQGKILHSKDILKTSSTDQSHD
jgi:hypothetical protein